MTDHNMTNGTCRASVPYDSLRFSLIVFVGTPIAVGGIISNSLLLATFMRKKHQNSPVLYLRCLALMDILMCLMYVPFFTVDAIALYHRVGWLHQIWHDYCLFLFSGAKIAQFCSTYLILMATFERFLLVVKTIYLRAFHSNTGRRVVIIIVFVGSVLCRAYTYFDYRIGFYAHCTVFTGFYFEDRLMKYDLYVSFNLYVMQLVQVFIPFILLVFLNLLIIVRMTRSLQNTTNASVAMLRKQPDKNAGKLWSSTVNFAASRRRIRNTTHTMIALVSCYLMCNSMDVFVKFLERLRPIPILKNADDVPTEFYTYSADFISILVVLNSLARLCIYVVCNPEVRAELAALFWPTPHDEQGAPAATSGEEDGGLIDGGPLAQTLRLTAGGDYAQRTANNHFGGGALHAVDVGRPLLGMTTTNGRNGFTHRPDDSAAIPHYNFGEIPRYPRENLL